MEKDTKYFVKYKIRPTVAMPYSHVLGNRTTCFTITCRDEKEAMHHGNVMNYDNVKYLRIFSKTYVKLFNVRIPVKKTILFTGNIK